MPRPRKCRKVCQLPLIQEFHPTGVPSQKEWVTLTVDEYEAVRLIDKQGFSQEDCSNYMQVARTTVQAIYTSARKKLALMLVEGRPLRIDGGDYQLCDGKEDTCGCGGCRRHRPCHQPTQQEETPMKIAIALDDNKEDVCIVLARAPYFLIREKGVDTIVENPGAQAQGGAGIQAAQFLVDQQVTDLITVRCGQNAADVFQAAGIRIYKSAGKTAAQDLTALENGTLERLESFHSGYQGIL